jgi:hypothetical protein
MSASNHERTIGLRNWFVCFVPEADIAKASSSISNTVLTDEVSRSLDFRGARSYNLGVVQRKAREMPHRSIDVESCPVDDRGDRQPQTAESHFLITWTHR